MHTDTIHKKNGKNIQNIFLYVYIFAIFFLFFFILPQYIPVSSQSCETCSTIVPNDQCSGLTSNVSCNEAYDSPPWTRMETKCCQGSEITCSYPLDQDPEASCYETYTFNSCNTNCYSSDCCKNGEIIAGHCGVFPGESCWNQSNYKLCCNDNGSGQSTACTRSDSCPSQYGQALCPSGYHEEQGTTCQVTNPADTTPQPQTFYYCSGISCTSAQYTNKASCEAERGTCYDATQTGCGGNCFVAFTCIYPCLPGSSCPSGYTTASGSCGTQNTVCCKPTALPSCSSLSASPSSPKTRQTSSLTATVSGNPTSVNWSIVNLFTCTGSIPANTSGATNTFTCGNSETFCTIKATPMNGTTAGTSCQTDVVCSPSVQTPTCGVCQYLDTATNTCKSSCSAGQTCSGNKCVSAFYTCSNTATCMSAGSFESTSACSSSNGGKTCFDSSNCNNACQKLSCNTSCLQNSQCQSGYCDQTSGACRNPDCSSTANCTCTPKSCNDFCTANSQCLSGFCDSSSGRCRTASCPTSSTCACPIAPPAPPPPPPVCSAFQCQYLDPSTNTCKSSCTAGQTCVSGTCKSPAACNGACTFDSDCLSGYTCVVTGGNPPKVCRKSSCTSDASCTCGAQCSPSSPCPALVQSGQEVAQCCSAGTCSIICSSCPAGYYLSGSICWKQKACNDFCLSSSQCQTGFCNVGVSNTCRNASCSSNTSCNCSVCSSSSDCPAGQVCTGGSCTVPVPTATPTPTPTPIPALGILSLSASCGIFNVLTDSSHIPATISWANPPANLWLQVVETKGIDPNSNPAILNNPSQAAWLLNKDSLTGFQKTLTVPPSFVNENSPTAGRTLYAREGNVGVWKNLGSCRVFHGYVVVDKIDAQGKGINPGKKDPDESCYSGNVQIKVDNVYSFIHSSTSSCNLYSYVLYDQVPKSHTIAISQFGNYTFTGASGYDGENVIANVTTQPISITDAEVNFGVGNNIPAPTPTPTPTPTITPTPIPQKPWIKVKGASFQRMRKAYGKNIVNTIPSLPSPFDSDDTGEAYFLIGDTVADKTGGVATAFTSLGMREETISSSGFYDISTYPSHGTPFDRDRFVQYMLSKKHYTVLQTVPQGISQGGIYWYKDTDGFFLPNLTLSSSSVFPPVPVVLISDEKIYITDNLTPSSSLAILAKSIVISPSVSSIKAILIADTIETGVNDTLGLKITGNMATTDLQQGRSYGALNNKPALFIVHDIKQYMDLLPYLSVVQGEKWERN